MSIPRTVLFMTILTLLLVFAGRALGGNTGMTIALIIAAAMSFGAYWFSDRMVLAMYGARPIRETEYPELHSMIWELCARADLPIPKLYPPSRRKRDELV